MEQGQLNWIANFIWGIADDVLRDLYVRGKYRDLILPMTVLRRLDAVLEPGRPPLMPLGESLALSGLLLGAVLGMPARAQEAPTTAAQDLAKHARRPLGDAVNLPVQSTTGCALAPRPRACETSH